MEEGELQADFAMGEINATKRKSIKSSVFSFYNLPILSDYF